MNSLTSLISPTMVASVLSGLLTLVPNPAISQIGLAGSMGLGGYAVAQTEKQRRKAGVNPNTVARDRTVRDLNQQLSDLQSHMRRQTRLREAAQKDAKAAQEARAGVLKKLKALEATMPKDAAVSPAVDVCEYTKTLQALRAELADKDAALETAYDALAARERDIAGLINGHTVLPRSARTELEEVIGALEAEKGKLSEVAHSLNNGLTQAGEMYKRKFEELEGQRELDEQATLQAVSQYQRRVHELEQAIAQAKADAAMPARFEGGSMDAKLGNDLIDMLYERGLVMGAVNLDHEPDRDLQVFLKPGKGASLEALKNLCSEVMIALRLTALPTVFYKRGIVEFRLPVNPQKAPEKRIPQVPLSRLEATVKRMNNARVIAPSGSGKTVFVNNLLHMALITMPSAESIVLDPKAIDDWGRFKPRYYGSECITGIQDLADSLAGRIDETVSRRHAGLQPLEYDKKIFAVDETGMLISDAKNADDSHIKERGEQAPNYFKRAKGSVAKLLQLGRSYGTVGVFVNQLPQPSLMGVNDGSFDGAVSFFLGGGIDKAISDVLADNLTKAQTKTLERELENRRTVGQEYLCLVADIPANDYYLIESPPEHHYANVYSASQSHFTKTGKAGKSRETLAATAGDAGEDVDAHSATGEAHTALTGSITAPISAPSEEAREPIGRCPKCNCRSHKLNGRKPDSKGRYRFFCHNDECSSKTFRSIDVG